MNNSQIPATQHALQLVGPDELELNHAKSVEAPQDRQILLKVEAVGLCFSDLKLLKQFDSHVRKAPLVRGIEPEVLEALPSYRPGKEPTVPGHEVCARIVAVGENVQHHRVGERVLLQADTRQLRTPQSNGAFGYNMEGGLQEYFLTDERIVLHQGQRFLMPVEDSKNAAAIALVEPWGCVECSYVTPERNRIKPGGHLLVVADAGHAIRGVKESFDPQAGPAQVTAVLADATQQQQLETLGASLQTQQDPDHLPDETFDDIIYFGASKETIDLLNDKLAPGGIINLVTAGKKIGQKVSVGVGRIHYGNTRWVGTVSEDAADGYAVIPETGEIRDDENVLVVGAGGPMGQMHAIRAICLDKSNVRVVASDFDQPRLDALASKAEPFAGRHDVAFRTANPKTQPLEETFTYVALMAPLGQLVAEAIERADTGCIVNIFAGIPMPTRHDLDMDACIAKRMFLFGTSGSLISHMQMVLEKVQADRLDTNCSVDAVCGMEGAAEGIRAVENRTIAGKIIVYPELTDMGLVPLDRIQEAYPSVARKLVNEMWTAEAEAELLRVAGRGENG
jgi:D-arabinose 1-dehydrogenase-like Zn-dependent alcohol dehydrogenase